MSIEANPSESLPFAGAAYFFDHCEAFERSTGCYDVVAGGATIAIDLDEDDTFEFCEEYDRKKYVSQVRYARPVDQRHYQTGCGVEGERLYMPDR